MGTPADVVKARMMNQPMDSNGKGLLYKGSIDCLSKTLKNEGFFGLYKGFLPCWLRMAPWSMTFWLSFEQIRKVFGAKSWGTWSSRPLTIEIIHGLLLVSLHSNMQEDQSSKPSKLIITNTQNNLSYILLIIIFVIVIFFFEIWYYEVQNWTSISNLVVYSLKLKALLIFIIDGIDFKWLSWSTEFW